VTAHSLFNHVAPPGAVNYVTCLLGATSLTRARHSVILSASN
jgi:hypothetical protein